MHWNVGVTDDIGDEEEGARLSTRQAAERLGVKPETVYAYVSRGLLSSRRSSGGRGSTFDAAEVEALGRAARRPAAAAREAAPEAMSVRTGITLIEPDGCWFRGVDARELAESCGFEQAADWLWTGRLVPGLRFTAPEALLAAARAAAEAMPAHCAAIDRLRAAVVAAAVADPLRFDLAEEAVLARARGLLPTLVGALPLRGDNCGAGLVRSLWPRLTERDATEVFVRALESAMILLLDHDLAASTLAARVAASARAHPYAVVSAGLGALDAPLHGAASAGAHRMLAEVVERGSAAAVVADILRAGRRVPGLGHRIYPGEDPRARALFTKLEQEPSCAAALEAAHEVVATAGRPANIDLALAVLTLSAGMDPEAGEAVFAVARTAGWIAHALEEYAERPLRLRPSGHYTGPRPPRPLPTPVPED
ncbi:citrate/2-methylcitrate synthase [Streptomyces albidus (ex Kaewkla and Franco 2022)]|uniref:citrate/2-methylcitrate synthase n=1 Tax=Streptomyces albidus (ex Kaewkla and Franco 2022) TaxID=722709 RepID=UPI0015EF6B7D|nr:citrate/2-methylcitrate synthase [Streptomyces albidus (ex Kaewkla and Franco 2022)]